MTKKEEIKTHLEKRMARLERFVDALPGLRVSDMIFEDLRMMLEEQVGEVEREMAEIEASEDEPVVRLV